jgi:ribosomal protein S20
MPKPQKQMNNILLDFENRNFNELLNSLSFKNKTGEVADKIIEILSLVDEMIDATKNTANIPGFLQESMGFYTGQFLELFDELETIIYQPKVDTTTLDNFKIKFNQWHTKCVLNQPGSSHPGFLDTYNTIKHFGRRGLREQDTKKADGISMQELSDKILETKNTQDKIRKIVAQESVSNYSKVFGEASKKYKDASTMWIIIGCAAIVGLFGLALLAPWEALLPIEGPSSYNISNIIIKSLLFGVVIFFISFSFKQYSANKHNSVLNLQRQTAMNSYKLFLESIDEKDKAERYTLMKVLASAVYEHVNTGFINEKNQAPKPGIVELTRMMQPGSPD